MKLPLVEVTFPAPPGNTQEERVESMRQFGRDCELEFQRRYPVLKDWFAKYDAPYLLAYCAIYFLAHPEGIDLEAEGRLEFFPHYLEIMQAFALMGPRTASATPLMSDASRLKAELREIGILMQRRLLNVPSAMTSQEDLERYRLRIQMMSHTIAVRNWAYHDQMRSITSALAEGVKDEFREVHGVDPARFSEMLFALGDVVTQRLQEHHKRMRLFMRKTSHRKMVAAYAEAFPDTVPMTEPQADALWLQAGKNIGKVRAMLAAHSDLRLERILTMSFQDLLDLYARPADAPALRKTLNRLSYAFGDLASHPPEHFILNNPIHARPFIRLGDDRYFSAIHGILPHLALGLIEELTDEDPGLRERYAAHRSAYLEREVVAAFQSGFRDAQSLAGAQWRMANAPDAHETDLLLVLDEFAIVVECKSGGVTPPARRGAPERLARTLKELIEEPSRQANNLIRFLKSSSEVVRFVNDEGETLDVDPAAIKYYIPVAVTFEHLGTISSNMKKLVAAGLADLQPDEFAACMSLQDLKCVMDLLRLDAEKVHYLARRREFERHVEYEGDEEDLLAFYLETGFNIGVAEYEGQLTMMLLGKAKELNPYFVLKGEGRPAVRPEPSRTRWWWDLLSALDQRRPKGWASASYTLLNLSKQDQQQFEAKTLKLVDRIKRGQVEYKHNWVGFLSGPAQRRFFVGGFPYATSDRKLRDDMMLTIINREEARDTRGAVVIGLDLSKMRYPFDVLVARLETNLFA